MYLAALNSNEIIKLKPLLSLVHILGKEDEMWMDEEETVECPYEVSHRILPSRLQYHLVRCKRSHPDVKLKVCPFDSTHYLKMNKYDEHVSTCPARASTEKIIFPQSRETLPYQSSLPKPSSTQDYFQDEEDWESELVNKSYDPLSKCMNTDVPLLPRNMTKSQRKAFREKEITRLTAIKQKEEAKVDLLPSLKRNI